MKRKDQPSTLSVYRESSWWKILSRADSHSLEEIVRLVEAHRQSESWRSSSLIMRCSSLRSAQQHLHEKSVNGLTSIRLLFDSARYFSSVLMIWSSFLVVPWVRFNETHQTALSQEARSTFEETGVGADALPHAVQVPGLVSSLGEDPMSRELLALDFALLLITARTHCIGSEIY